MGSRLNTPPFLVIAASALLLSAVLGFVLGSMGQGVAVIPGAAPAELHPFMPLPQARAVPGTADQPLPELPPVAPSVTEPGPVPGDVSPRLPQPDAPPPRELAPGRVDVLQEAPPLIRQTGSIEVTLKDHQERMMPIATLALDMSSGPLGWHPLPVTPERVAAERGLFRFDGLQPGEYRVRSTAANFAPAEEIVTLSGAGTVSVTLVLQPMQHGVVELYPRFEDGQVPQTVTVSINYHTDLSPNIGRFGEYTDAVAASAGRISPVHYGAQVADTGVLRVALNVGARAEITLTAMREGHNWTGSVRVEQRGMETRESVTLRRSNGAAPGTGAPGSPVRVDIILTVNGAEDTQITRVHLRPSLEGAAYRPPHRMEGNHFVWENVAPGTWYLVADVPNVHAAFVTEVPVTFSAQHRFDIRTGHLRVHAEREPGSPDPGEGQALYRVRLRPRGAGMLERTYNGDLTGRQAAHIDFFVPEGRYEVRVDAPDTAPGISAEPETAEASVAAGGASSLAFTLRAGAGLRFRATTQSGAAFPHPEFLVTTYPAGSVPPAQQSRVRKGGPDGLCVLESVPYGRVYLHIWTASADWNNPDRVFELNLTAYQVTDLGNVIAAP